MGANPAQSGVQMDNGSHPATHAIATGVPPSSTSGPPSGPSPSPHTGTVEGPAEPPQGVDGDPRRTIAVRTGTPPAHGPDARDPPHPAQGVGPYRTAHRRGAGRGAGTPADALLAGPHSACGQVRPPGLPQTAATRQGHTAAGVLEQWLALQNPLTAQGHWYLHQLLLLPRAAPEHRRQNPYHTHPERLGAQSFPQPAQPAPPLGQGPEALLQGPPLDKPTTVQQRGSSNAERAEPDRTNCGVMAWTATCRHLAQDTTRLRRYRPADRTALVSAVAAVTMAPVAPCPVRLPPHIPHIGF